MAKDHGSCQITISKSRIQAPPQMERVSESPNPRVMCPFIHHSTPTRVLAVRINFPPLAGLAPHPIPYPPWLQISTSNLPTYWAALFPSVAGESHKIQAFRPSSTFVPLERPLSFSCSPFAMGEHFSSVGKRDIISCTHCFIPASFWVSLIVL